MITTEMNTSNNKGRVIWSESTYWDTGSECKRWQWWPKLKCTPVMTMKVWCLMGHLIWIYWVNKVRTSISLQDHHIYSVWQMWQRFTISSSNEIDRFEWIPVWLTRMDMIQMTNIGKYLSDPHWFTDGAALTGPSSTSMLDFSQAFANAFTTRASTSPETSRKVSNVDTMHLKWT